MKKTKRNFIVVCNDSIGNEFIWEVYTLDGDTPKNSEYFFKDGDLPSWESQYKIADKIDKGQYIELYNNKKN